MGSCQSQHTAEGDTPAASAQALPELYTGEMAALLKSSTMHTAPGGLGHTLEQKVVLHWQAPLSALASTGEGKRGLPLWWQVCVHS